MLSGPSHAKRLATPSHVWLLPQIPAYLLEWVSLGDTTTEPHLQPGRDRLESNVENAGESKKVILAWPRSCATLVILPSSVGVEEFGSGSPGSVLLQLGYAMSAQAYV